MIRPPHLLALLGSLLALPGAECGPLEDFPLEVACGLAEGAPAPPGGARVLEDLPFDAQRGWGHVGGEARREASAVISGGDPRWPCAFRQGLRRYSFQVPNGEYLVSLWFLETEAGAAGLRVFEVLAGEEPLMRVDIAGEAGDFTWLRREALARVREGWLDLVFSPLPGSLPARISRIRLQRAGDLPAAPPPPAGVRVEPGPGEVAVLWEPPAALGVAGYGVFASESPAGPFVSLTELPLTATRFVAGRREGPGGYYRVRAYGVRGGQSPLTPPLAGRAAPPPGALRTLALEAAPREMAKLFLFSRPPAEAAGVLQSQGTPTAVEVSCLTEPHRWQAKKSYRLLLGPGPGRTILGRRELTLLAEAGDPTLLREKLAADLERALGLPAPEAAHVHLLLNGRYQGVYLDREPVGAAFRRRAGLDRFGALVRVPGSMRLLRGWEPYGESRGQSGDLMGLAQLVHELNRLEEGELDAYFEERFYLSRVIDRLALAAVRGVDPTLPGAEPLPYLLSDSRNGKWECFAGDRRGGDLGIEDFKPPRQASSPERARRSLLGFTLDGAALRDGAGGGEARFRVLESRLLSRPALRERYLARVEEIAGKLLPPELFDDVLGRARAPLLGALLPEGALLPAGAEKPQAPRDPRFWPPDLSHSEGGAAFRRSAADLASFYRSHREELLAAVARERSRPRHPLVLNEVCLRPGSATEPLAMGAPWVEIANVSGAEADLEGHFLTDDLDRPRGYRLPSLKLPPGGKALLVFAGEPPAGSRALTCPLRPSPDGGELGLFVARGSAQPEPVDALHYGRQTEGFASARLADGSAAWGMVRSPTPGAANSGEAALPPPWRYRAGVEVRRSGEMVLWLYLPRLEGVPEGGVAEVAIHLRALEGGQGGPEGRDFTRLEMSYAKESYRYEHVLGAPFHGRPGEYFFTARSPGGVERAYPLPGPQVPLRLPLKPPLFINELLPRPSRPGPHLEFVELYNAGDVPLSADGMFLSDDRRNPTKFRLSAPAPVPPRGFLVVFTDGRGEGLHANFRLGNAGEYLGLFARAEEGNITVDQVAFPAIPVDRAYGRERDGAKGFKVWKDPTPGARNIPRIPREPGKDGAPEEGAAPPGAVPATSPAAGRQPPAARGPTSEAEEDDEER